MEHLKIGLLAIATGEKYHQFIQPFINSLNRYFFNNHLVHLFLWTDDPKGYCENQFKLEDRGMPWASLMRYHTFLSEEEKIEKMDYLFYCDIDSLFVDFIAEEILPEDGLVAVRHPGYYFAEQFKPPYEKNPGSYAFVPEEKYFAGGFQGGSVKQFIDAMKLMRKSIDADYEIQYIARWNDESHWNALLHYFVPDVELTPEYCYPETMIDEYYKKIWPKDFNPKPKIVILDKKWKHNDKEKLEVKGILNDL